MNNDKIEKNTEIAKDLEIVLAKLKDSLFEPKKHEKLIKSQLQLFQAKIARNCKIYWGEQFQWWIFKKKL